MRFGPFKGMNNLAAEYALPQDTVRNAVSVDFDNAGKGTRRNGYTKRYNGLGLAGGFSCSQGMFIIEHGYLRLVNTTTWMATTIATGITGTEFAAYEFDEVLYFSDGTKNLKIVDGVATQWGITVPPSPVIYTNAGTFGAGDYMCCLTYVDTNGHESGASDISVITAPADCSFAFVGLPNSQDAAVVATRIYLTTANGDIFFQCAEVANGVSTASILFDYDGGKQLETQFMTKPPAGRTIRNYKGKMIIAKGSYVYFSEPFAPDLFSVLGKGVFRFSQDVTVVEPVSDGIWIVADKTYFFAGDELQRRTVLEYGAAFGTGGTMKDTGDVAWFSDRGQIIAGNGGEFKNIQENQVAPDYSDTGVTLIRKDNGNRQAITVVKNPTMSPRANRSFIDMEVIRRAT